MLSPLRLSFRLGENLVEHAAVVEEALLRRLPAAELVIDGEEVHLRELRSIFCLGFRADRTVVILADDVMRLGRVEIFEIGFGELEIERKSTRMNDRKQCEHSMPACASKKKR